MSIAIGVDLGGTKIAAGLVDDTGTILERAELPSNMDDGEALGEQIAELVSMLGSPECDGLGIGAAGLIDYESGYYIFGPNTGLADFHLVDVVSAAVGMQVLLDNDANCAAWAEYDFGVGRGCRHFICVTLGTGIGGGFVLDGRPYRGSHGGAAEIGHMMVDPDGPVCGCGRRGCWEQYASGLALERMAREGLPDHPESVLAAIASEGPVRGKAISEAARSGDEFAKGLITELATWVGWGLGSLVNVLEPERIAIAGGIVRDWDLLAPTAIPAMNERVEASSRRQQHAEVLPAALGADAGIVGGACLVFDRDA